MVSRKNLKNSFALISVYDKKKLNYLCKNLINYNYGIISTGKTYKAITKLGFKCSEISKVTKFREILDGRVKTINPKIFGSILYKRNNKQHELEFNDLNIPKIDIVITNFYPFEEISKNYSKSEIIEMIDIGGPALSRAAAKNFEYLTTISEISDYKEFIDNLKKNNGVTDIDFRKKMASKVFKLTSNYDKNINEWFINNEIKKNKIVLRYGENPNQKSFIVNKKNQSIFDYQISGKTISYNNIIDVDSGLKCLSEFNEATSIIIKHTNPCGVACSYNIYEAFVKSFLSDQKSAFGGVVLINRKLTERLAKKMSKYFFEVIVAPKFDSKALEILKRKKNLIILEIGKIKVGSHQIRSTIFGNLYQDTNNKKINKNSIKIVSKKKSSDKLVNDLVFAFKVAKHVNSNAIVLASNKQTLGLGIGQTNRFESLKLSLNKMKLNFKNKKFVCVSDGFFPFSDSIKLLKKNGCDVVAQPAGSINDEEIIEYAIQNSMSFYHISARLFKH